MRLLPACLDCCLPRAYRADKRTVLQLRMDELDRAFAAAHLAMDVIDDEHQIAKLRHAQKVAREVHGEIHPARQAARRARPESHPEGHLVRSLLHHDALARGGAGPS